MSILDLLRMWVAEQIFRHEIVIVVRLHHIRPRAEIDRVLQQLTELTGYRAVAVPSQETELRIEFLPARRAAREQECHATTTSTHRAA